MYIAAENVNAENTQRNIDEEYPVPRQVVNQKTAEQRTDKTGNTPDGADAALDDGTFLQREDIADYREAYRQDSTCAHALYGAEQYELEHALRQSTQYTADKKN